MLHRAWADGEPQRSLVDACLTLADGHAERVAALHMIELRADRSTAITLGADKAYDAEDFVNEPRSMNVTPMLRRTPAAAALRSTGERPGTAAMPSASASASASRRHWVGSRRSPSKRRPAFVAAITSDGLLPSLRRLQSGAAPDHALMKGASECGRSLKNTCKAHAADHSPMDSSKSTCACSGGRDHHVSRRPAVGYPHVVLHARVIAGVAVLGL